MSTGAATPEMLARMAAIGQLLLTQDNRITEHPLFIVFQKRRYGGLEADYCSDNWCWITTDGDADEADAKTARLLNAIDKKSAYTWNKGQAALMKKWRKIGYLEVDEFVTCCFTEEGCKAYLRNNGHNLRQPYIYATSAHRNQEMIDLRHALAAISGGTRVQQPA